jgi:hypothetical protein
MKIRFLTSCMSSEGVFTASREYEMGDELAAGFIAAGHAVAVEMFEEAVRNDEIVETAVKTSGKSKGRK